MAWTLDATSGVLTHAGTTRDFWDPGVTLPAQVEIRCQLQAYSHNIKVLVRGSLDGRTGYEVGIEGSNLIIRKITVGVTGSALQTTAHGLGASESFTLVVRLTADEIKATVVKTSGAELSVTETSDDWSAQTAWGFVSAVDGATIGQATYAEVGLTSTTIADVLVIVVGGDVWANYGNGFERLGSRAFPTTCQVSMDTLDGHVYAVGGGKAIDIDPGARTVAAWTASSGSLPGADGAGTTKASVVCSYSGRIWLGGIEDETNNLYASAIGEPNTWDTAELEEGRAVAVGVGRTQAVADAVVALCVSSTNALLIGCTNSLSVLLGDPAEAGQLVPLSQSNGCSGLNAITTASEGLNVVHCPEGLYLAQPGASPTPISRDVLTELIQYPRVYRSDYQVTLIRDPARHGLHIFLSQESGSTHFWYDERTGGYEAGAGGFFPEQYPFTPTCAAIWQGRVIIGTSDGHLVEFVDDGSRSDYGTTAIDGYFTLTLVDEDPYDNDTIVDHVYGVLGVNSGDAELTVYGGQTAEAAYDSTERWSLGTFTLPQNPQRVYVRKRGSALALKLRNATAAEDLVFEALEADVRTGRPLSRSGWKPALAVGTPCSVPVGSSGGGSNTGGSPVSGPGAGSVPYGNYASGAVSGAGSTPADPENDGGTVTVPD